MRASSSKFDVGDHRLPDAELFSDSALADAGTEKIAYISDVVRSEARLELPVIGMGSVPLLVCMVFDRQCPPKIVGAGIFWISIPVRNLMLVAWFWAIKCFADKLVNEFAFLRMPAHRQLDGRISAARVTPWNKKPGLGTLARQNATKVANLVIGIALNREPNFIHSPVLTLAGG